MGILRLVCFNIIIILWALIYQIFGPYLIAGYFIFIFYALIPS